MCVYAGKSVQGKIQFIHKVVTRALINQSPLILKILIKEAKRKGRKKHKFIIKPLQ